MVNLPMVSVIVPVYNGAAYLRDTLDSLLAGDYPGYHLGAMLARRELFETAGTLDATHRYTDDVRWFFEAKDSGIPMQHLPEVVLFRRVHGGNNSAQVTTLHRELLAIAKRSIAHQHRAATASTQ
jgi:cellulose synthase/poly-beta-1,6-N-acetylglucosamine synthase-like glycosyltransferase